VGGIGWRLLTAAWPQVSCDILKTFIFLAMAFLPQVACHGFAGSAGGTPAFPDREIRRGTTKQGGKNFSSQRGGLPLLFLQMKKPDLIWETDSCNLHFPMGRFKRPS
jgi:hypothetical protein